MKKTAEYDQDDIIRMLAKKHGVATQNVEMRVRHTPANNENDFQDYTWITWTVTTHVDDDQVEGFK